MIAGSGELDKTGAKTKCFFDISLKSKLHIENTKDQLISKANFKVFI